MKRSITGSIFVAVIMVFASISMATVETPITNDLFLALDGSDVTESGGSVSSWNNQASGAGVSADFIQGTATSQPTLVSGAVNDLPALSFDGNSDFVVNTADSNWDWDYDSNTNDAARWTVFIVKNHVATNTDQMLMRSGYDDFREGIDTASSVNLWSVFCGGDRLEIHSRNSAGTYTRAYKNGALITNEWQIIGGLYKVGTVDPSIMVFVDGDQVASTTANTTRQMSGHRYTRIGANTYSPYMNFNGLIAEVLVYKRALNFIEISRVNDYLAKKYGVSRVALHCTMDDSDVNRSGAYPHRR